MHQNKKLYWKSLITAEVKTKIGNKNSFFKYMGSTPWEDDM